MIDSKEDVFAMYGATAYYAQMFEIGLRSILLLAHILKDPSMTKAGVEQRSLKITRSNIGLLLTEIKKRYPVQPELEKSFNELRVKRNDLIHHYFFNNAFRMTNDEGRKAVAVELKGLFIEFKIADELTDNLVAQIRKDLGWSEEKFMELVKERFAKETGLELEDI
jgi:hypothetical protein